MGSPQDPVRSGLTAPGSMADGPVDPPTNAPASGARVRIADVARDAGVSTASVSLVLADRPGPSEATRARVLEVADRLGYRPDRAASALARRSSRLLGLMIDVANPFHADLVEAIHRHAEAAGWDVVLSTVTAHRDEARAISTLVDFRCESLLLLGSLAGRDRLLELAEGRRVVVIGRPLSPVGIDVVGADDELGARLVVDHLVATGHRDIAFVDGPRGAISTTRRRGYRAAMRAHRLGERIRVVAGGSTQADGAEAGRVLLSRSHDPEGGAATQGDPTRLDAVFAYNDRCAVGVVDAFARAGLRVPEDVAVAGYDDSMLARMQHLDLTSVSQEPDETARHAVDLAVAGPQTEPRDEGVGRQIVVTPRLVVRSSTRGARSD